MFLLRPNCIATGIEEYHTQKKSLKSCVIMLYQYRTIQRFLQRLN